MQVSNLIRLLASSMTCPNRDVHRSQIKLYTNVHITRFGSFPISHFLLTPCQCECTTELEEKNKARKKKDNNISTQIITTSIFLHATVLLRNWFNPI